MLSLPTSLIKTCITWSVISTLLAIAGYGQGRINDKDLENMMRNLRDDAKSFRAPFTSALKKSAIRKTSQAKNAERLAEVFEKQSEALLNNFKKTKKGDARLSAVQSSGQQLNSIVSSTDLGPRVAQRWSKIRTELQQVLSAYGLTALDANENPRGIGPVAGSGSAEACAQGVGRERADRLVHECMQVSTATHPPCNAENSCSLIIDEIKRGCGMLDAQDAPAFCNEYK